MILQCPVCDSLRWIAFDAAVECCRCGYIYRYADLWREYGEFSLQETAGSWRVIVQEVVGA